MEVKISYYVSHECQKKVYLETGKPLARQQSMHANATEEDFPYLTLHDDGTLFLNLANDHEHYDKAATQAAEILHQSPIWKAGVAPSGLGCIEADQRTNALVDIQAVLKTKQDAKQQRQKDRERTRTESEILNLDLLRRARAHFFEAEDLRIPASAYGDLRKTLMAVFNCDDSKAAGDVLRGSLKYEMDSEWRNESNTRNRIDELMACLAGDMDDLRNKLVDRANLDMELNKKLSELGEKLAELDSKLAESMPVRGFQEALAKRINEADSFVAGLDGRLVQLERALRRIVRKKPRNGRRRPRTKNA